MKSLLRFALLSALLSAAAWGQNIEPVYQMGTNPFVVSMSIPVSTQYCRPEVPTVTVQPSPCQHHIVVIVGPYTGDAEHLVVAVGFMVQKPDSRLMVRKSESRLVPPSGGVVTFSWDSPPNARNVTVTPVKASGDAIVVQIFR